MENDITAKCKEVKWCKYSDQIISLKEIGGQSGGYTLLLHMPLINGFFLRPDVTILKQERAEPVKEKEAPFVFIKKWRMKPYWLTWGHVHHVFSGIW